MWGKIADVLCVAGWVLLGVAAGIVVLAVAYFVFACLCGLFVNPKKEYNKNSPFYRFLVNSLTVMVLFILQVKVHITGKEKIPTGERYLLVSNHRSNYDPIVQIRVLLSHKLAFISKGSNFKIPFFGNIIRKLCFMEIDRENPRNAIKTVDRAAKLIKADEVSVGVYPEGTRSKTGELLPFHNSVFKVAQRANVPIVVCSLRGTEKIHKRTPWRRTHVYIDVLEVISKEDVAAMRTAELGERIRTEILENLQKAEAENE